MTAKTKVIVSVTTTAFLAAVTVLVVNAVLLSNFIDSGQIAHKADTIIYLIFIGLLVTLIFLAISLPFSIKTAKTLSAPIEKMQDQSQFDALTGIYNRRYVDENLKNLIGFMSRSGGKLSLLVISIDFFKNYNDAYGYNKGDSCLKIVANLLTKGISRAEDFVARYTGKEFIAVLPNTDENGAHIIAQRFISIIKECKIPHEKNEVSDILTISIGAVTGSVNHSQNGDEYIGRAYELMNQSMADGYNRFTFENL